MDIELLKELAIARDALKHVNEDTKIAQQSLEKTQEYADLLAKKEEQDKWMQEESNLTKKIKEDGLGKRECKNAFCSGRESP